MENRSVAQDAENQNVKKSGKSPTLDAADSTYTVEMSHNLSAIPSSDRPRRVWLPSILNIVVTATMAGVFAGYLRATFVKVDTDGVYVRASAGRVLLITSLVSSLAFMSLPLLAGILSYTAASRWLRFSRQAANVGNTTASERNLPTPIQFVLLANLCSTGSLVTVMQCIGYWFTPHSSRSHVSPLFRTVLSIFIPFVMLVYAITLVEGFWLHAVVETKVLPMPSQQFGSISAFGRVLDDQCKRAPVYPNCGLQLPCSVQNLQEDCSQPGNAIYQLRGLDAGLLTANNISRSDMVRVLEQADGPQVTAILMSSQDTSDTTYVAETTGVRVTCKNLTPECNVTVFQPGDGPTPGSVGYVCLGKPGLRNTVGQGPSGGWNLTQFEPSGTELRLDGQEDNPFPVAFSMIWDMDMGELNGVAGDNNHSLVGGFVHTRGPRSYGLLYCDVEVLQPVRYRNNRGRLEIVSVTTAPRNSPSVWAVSGAFLNGPTTALMYTKGQPSVLVPPNYREASVLHSYANSIATVALGQTSGVHVPAPALFQQRIDLVQATFIPWAPILLFWIFVLFYWFTVAALAVYTILTTNHDDDSTKSLIVAQHFSRPATLLLNYLRIPEGEADYSRLQVAVRDDERVDFTFG